MKDRRNQFFSTGMGGKKGIPGNIFAKFDKKTDKFIGITIPIVFEKLRRYMVGGIRYAFIEQAA